MRGHMPKNLETESLHFMLDLYLYSMPAVYQDLPIDIKMDKLMPSSVFSSANIQNVSAAFEISIFLVFMMIDM